ncbi:hypothetical protein FOPE_06274 [Fonsecaea pedrosoi]|nr:hypothetical protein FOPE_06274 [Fonsecaea pedrosoi]
MEQFGKIIEVFVNTSDVLAFVWGPLKFLLLVSSTSAECLDKILDAYEQIGELLPLLQQYESLFQQHPEMQKVLAMMYKDILEFHLPAIRVLDRSGWKHLFRSAWGDFNTKFEGILRNLNRHGQLIESQFNLLQARQHEAHQTEVLRAILDVEQEVRLARELIEKEEKIRKQEQLSAIRVWIGGNTTCDSHESAKSAREEYAQTGLWITQKEKVSSWLADDLPRSPILWMHGIPGAGKTILASIIIQACLEACVRQNQHRAAYFYCRRDDVTTTTCVGILKGLLAQQLYWYRGDDVESDLTPDLVPFFDEERRKSCEPVLSSDQITKKLFRTVSGEGQRQYIVVDGLDECRQEERRSLLPFLTSLVKGVDDREPSKLRILIISQEEPDIRGLLSSAEEFAITRDDNSQDIRAFVQAWTVKIQEKFGLGDQASSLLAQHTCGNAAGQFLFAKLVMENLHQQLDLRGLQRELETERFPKELAEA